MRLNQLAAVSLKIKCIKYQRWGNEDRNLEDQAEQAAVGRADNEELQAQEHCWVVPLQKMETDPALVHVLQTLIPLLPAAAAAVPMPSDCYYP